MLTVLWKIFIGVLMVLRRGLVVLASKTRDPRTNKLRNIEAHFYFPWQEGVMWKKKRVVTTKLGKKRIRTSRKIKDRIREELPPGWTLEDWWDWAPKIKGRPEARWKNYKKPLRTDYRWEFPREAVDKYNIKKGEVKFIELPFPTKDREEVIENSKYVLLKWLEDNGFLIPPFETGGWDEQAMGQYAIGVELETKDLKNNEFALRVYDNDYDKISIKSTFRYNTRWYMSKKMIRNVLSLAKKNLVEGSLNLKRKKMWKKKSKSVSLSDFTG